MEINFSKTRIVMSRCSGFKSVFIYFVLFQLLQHQQEQVKQGACQAAPNLSLLKHQHQFLLSKKELPLQEAF